MSEFSESFHLRSEDRADGVDLLRRAKTTGYVFEPRDGWVTVLSPRGSMPGLGDREERVLAAAKVDAWVRVSRDSGNLVLASSLRLPRHEWCESRHPHPAARVEVDAEGHLVADEEGSAESRSSCRTRETSTSSSRRS